MSRRTTQTTQTVDKIQQMIDALNTINGIEFQEDAWDDKAPNNYGVVELTGETANDYADGVKIAQAYSVTITMYVSGNSHQWITRVQDVLDQLKVRYTMPTREYLQDINKVRWIWTARVRRPIVREVAANG